MSYNWDLLVFGPEFAMLRIPRPVWDRLGRNSSLKGFPQKDSPPEDGERTTDRRKTTEKFTSRWKTTEIVKSLKTYLLQSPNWRAVLTLSLSTNVAENVSAGKASIFAQAKPFTLQTLGHVSSNCWRMLYILLSSFQGLGIKPPGSLAVFTGRSSHFEDQPLSAGA